MSKNIEEIVESVLPEPVGLFWQEGERKCREIDRNYLKQAITEGKLVVPLSEEDIQHIMYDPDVIDRAQAIYKAQFGGNK